METSRRDGAGPAGGMKRPVCPEAARDQGGESRQENGRHINRRKSRADPTGLGNKAKSKAGDPDHGPGSARDRMRNGQCARNARPESDPSHKRTHEHTAPEPVVEIVHFAGAPGVVSLVSLITSSSLNGTVSFR